MTIVVGFVPRPEGRAALEAALREVRGTGERLLVVHTVRMGEPGPPDPDVVAELDAVEGRLAREGIDHEVRVVTGGLAPADELLDAVAGSRARCLVIGLRRRPVLGRLIAGATAQQVVLDAPCDVLTVKAADR